jgi:hypothetical protein
LGVRRLGTCDVASFGKTIGKDNCIAIVIVASDLVLFD